MKFTETPLAGAFLIEIEPVADERGFFARTFCSRELEERGLQLAIAQCSISVTTHAGTLRGMHYQVAPHGEVKVVRCVAGQIYDVIVDLRIDSPTRWRWHAVTLDGLARSALYIPEGFAHGFLTLTPNVEVFYQISSNYHPEAARGLRWDDPMLAIEWPRTPELVSERDRNYALLEAAHG